MELPGLEPMAPALNVSALLPQPQRSLGQAYANTYYISLRSSPLPCKTSPTGSLAIHYVLKGELS